MRVEVLSRAIGALVGGGTLVLAVLTALGLFGLLLALAALGQGRENAEQDKKDYQ